MPPPPRPVPPDPRCQSAADRQRRRRALPRALIIVPLLLLGCSRRQVLAATTPLTLTGKVCAEPGDRPVPHAFVGVNGVGTVADAAGAYTIAVPGAARLFVEADAQGYQSDGAFTVSGPGDAPLTGRVGFSFCGSAGLHGAFSSADGRVRLTPFATVRPAAATGLAIGGLSAIPLEANAAVTRPDGRAELIPLTRRGAAFGLTLPLIAGPGRYLLEINAATGFAALKTAIFRGPYVPPAPPPRYVGDPPGAAVETLRTAALAGLNRYRAVAGLPPLRRDPRLDREAQAHSDDIIAAGYLLRHAHIGSDGSDPGVRVRLAGVPYRELAEDVGMGDSVQEVLVGLMDSPGHRWAILGNFALVGVGVQRQGSSLVLTADFVR